MFGRLSPIRFFSVSGTWDNPGNMNFEFDTRTVAALATKHPRWCTMYRKRFQSLPLDGAACSGRLKIGSSLPTLSSVYFDEDSTEKLIQISNVPSTLSIQAQSIITIEACSLKEPKERKTIIYDNGRYLELHH